MRWLGALSLGQLVSRAQLQQKPFGQRRDCVVLVFRGQGVPADSDSSDMRGAMRGGRGRGALPGAIAGYR